MANGSEHPTLPAGAQLSHPALYNFTRPEIIDTLSGAAAQVPQPKACTTDEWCMFGAKLAVAIGEPQLSNVFVGDFPWGNVFNSLMLRKPEQRQRFWSWFFSGAIPEVGLQVGDTLATWMTKGIVPTSADIARLKPVERIRLAENHIRKYGRIIAEVAELQVAGGDLLRGGVKVTADWANARFIHENVAWTDENRAMTILLRPVRQGTWEYAWSVVRQLTELIVAEDIKAVAQTLIDWGLRQALSYARQAGQNLAETMRGVYREGVQIGRMTDKMEEYLRWACQGHLGILIGSGVRDQKQSAGPVLDPAFHLVQVWMLGYWPIGLKGSCYYIHNLFPRAVPTE